MITSSIIGAIEGVPRKIYLAVDKINLEADDGEPAWVLLAEMLMQQNIQLIPIRLAEVESIPEDAEGFALIGPQYDLNEREMKILSNYWDRQQSALLVTLDPKAKLNNLRIFLRSYGITPRHDRVVTTENGHDPLQRPSHLLPRSRNQPASSVENQRYFRGIYLQSGGRRRRRPATQQTHPAHSTGRSLGRLVG